MPRHSSLVGGSNAGTTLLCSGSIDERRKAGPDHNVYAAEGTCLHTIMEQVNERDLGHEKILKIYEGMLWADLLHEADEIEAYGSNKISRELLEDKIFPALKCFDEVVPPEANFRLEEKLDYRLIDQSPIDAAFEISEGDASASGTADVLFEVWNGGTCHRAGLIDYKFGEGHIVDPEDNAQLKFYLAAAIHMGALPVVDEYEAWVIQPAGKLDPSRYARKAVYTFAELVEFALDLREAVEGKRQYQTGAHCKFCNGKLTCQAYKDLLGRVERTDVAGLDAKGLSQMLELIGTLTAFVTDVQAAALRNAKQGVTIPGWKLETGQGSRVWKDEGAAWAALSRLGLAANERTIKKTISAPQALTLLTKKRVPDKQINRFENRHVYRPETPERLVKTKPGEADGDAFTKLAKAMEVSS